MCDICEGMLWVCENHPYEKWDVDKGGCQLCGGAGSPCECNPEAKMPPNIVVCCSVDDKAIYSN
jgi:hypothetical protein